MVAQRHRYRGATAATLDLATAGNGDKGDLIRVRATVDDGSATSAPVTSDPLTVANSAPVFATDLQDRNSTVGDAVNIDAGATDADNDTLTYSATGLPAGISIAPATGAITGTVAAGSTGTHNVTVTVGDGDLTASDTFTWTVSALNTPPVVDTVTVTPAAPDTNQTLTANVTSHDADGDLLTPSYQWTRNGTDIAGATGSLLDLSAAGNGSRGDAIRVRVTVTDGSATSAPVTSDPVSVVNSAPHFTTNLQDRSDTVGDVANLDANATDADNDALTYSATGLPAGISIDPASGVISGTLGAGAAGTHNVTITVSDGTLTDTDTLTWTVASANTPPVVDSVSVAPASPTTNQTLTATVTSHDANNDPLTTAYQWTRNGADIAGATGSTLDLSGANNGNRGDLIRVRVTVNDGAATSPAVTSSPVTIANSAPSATVGLAPASPDTNAIVTATATRSDADADAVSLHYVWKVNGTTRRTTDTTALTDTFDLSVAGNGDAGDTVSVEVTPNDGTVNGTLASAQVTVAAAAQTVYASDLFARSVLNNWGSAVTGGLYTLQGTVADYDVNGTLGTIVLGAPGTNRSAVLGSVSVRDSELSFRFTTDKAATGGVPVHLRHPAPHQLHQRVPRHSALGTRRRRLPPGQQRRQRHRDLDRQRSPRHRTDRRTRSIHPRPRPIQRRQPHHHPHPRLGRRQRRTQHLELHRHQQRSRPPGRRRPRPPRLPRLRHHQRPRPRHLRRPPRHLHRRRQHAAGCGQRVGCAGVADDQSDADGDGHEP